MTTPDTIQPTDERATTYCTAQPAEISRVLWEILQDLGYRWEDVRVLVVHERLVWEKAPNGIVWLLDGAVILRWNELQLRFVKPELETTPAQ